MHQFDSRALTAQALQHRPTAVMSQRSVPPAPGPAGSPEDPDSGTHGIGLSLVRQAHKDAAPTPQPLRDVLRTLCNAVLVRMTAEPRPTPKPVLPEADTDAPVGEAAGAGDGTGMQASRARSRGKS